MWSAGFLSQLVNELEILSLSGSSGGALVAAFAAANLDDPKRITESRFKAKPLSELLHLDPSRLLSSAMTMILGNISGFVSHSMMTRFVKNHIDLSRIKCSLSVVSTNLSEDSICSKRLDKYTSQLFPNYIAASAAIPILCEPFILGGHILVDGGILCPVPFQEVLKHRAASELDSTCLILDTWSCMSHEKNDRPIVTDILKWSIRSSVKSLAKYQELSFNETMARNNWPYEVVKPSEMPVNPLDFSEQALITAFDIGVSDGRKFTANRK